MDGIDKERWQLLNPLLDELLDADSAARLERLAQIRATDPALADEVAALLAAQVSAEQDGFLGGAPLLTPAASLAGHEVGNYTLECLLGEGGMGSVWLAHRSDGRYHGMAAVKFLNRAMLGRGGLARFAREGNLLARLSHPNIAHLIDAGVTDGQPFLVLEYVQGVPIDIWCETQALGVKARVRLLLEVLAAVAHAHSRLVLHRDLKPSNILVTPEGRVKLLDFGVAKLLQHDPSDAPVTQLAGRAFTPEYAAPEQVQDGELSMATDVYAFGVLMYVLLTGNHPTATPDATPVERLRALVETEPRRPSESTTRGGSASAGVGAGTPRQLERALRGDLDNIIAKALRKAPGDRYPTAAELAEDLRRYLADEPVSAQPDTAGYRLRKFVRRHRLATGAASATLLALLLGVAGTTWQAYEARRSRDSALRELSYAEASNEFMTFLLTEGSDKPFTTAELLDRAAASVDRQFADDPELRARLQYVIGSQYANLADYPKSATVLAQAQQSAQRASNPSLALAIDCTRAGVDFFNGQSAEVAAAAFAPVRKRLDAMGTGDPALLSDCHSIFTLYYREIQQPALSMASAQQALALLRTPRPGQRSSAIVARAQLADTYQQATRYDAAVAQYESAIRELTAMGRENTAAAMSIFSDYARMLDSAGQTLRAAEQFRRAVQSQALSGRSENLSLNNNYANVLVALGRFDAADQFIQAARRAAQASGNPRERGRLQGSLAGYYCAIKDLARCETELDNARATLRTVLPANHTYFAALDYLRGSVEFNRGHYAAAREYLQKVLEIFSKTSATGANVMRATSLLARTEARLGNTGAALELAARSVAMARERYTGFPHSGWIGVVLLAQGRVQMDTGNREAARATLREALAHFQATDGDDAPTTTDTRQLLAEAGG
jgi:serine/threonine-protein kinase